MGHGDEIVLADAHFPGHSIHSRTLRADGLSITPLLDGILPLLTLDSYDDSPVVMMEVVPGDVVDPEIERRYREVIDRWAPGTPPIRKLARSAFYQRAGQAFAILMTGDIATYANIILKKGVTPLST